MSTSRIATAVHRLAGLFVQEPDRHVSVAEVQQLTGLDPPACQIVLETLRDARFLKRVKDGRYTRATPPANDH
jgi:predicted transcriptional regulator of viral defense system